MTEVNAPQKVDVDSLEAGRELDALVAERVMGWLPHFRNTAHWVDAEIADTVGSLDYRVRGIVGEWSPSKDIAVAWQVVEKLRAGNWLVRIQEMPDGFPFLAGGGWRDEETREIHRRSMCQLYPGRPLRDTHGFGLRDMVTFADTAPLAICKATLMAMEATSKAR